MEEKSVEVKILYSDNDIRKSLRYFLNNIHRIWILFYCFGIVFTGILIYGFVKGFNSYISITVTTSLIVFLLYYSYYYYRPMSAYLGVYRQIRGGTYNFTLNEIIIEGEKVKSICDWSLFNKAYEIPNAFVLSDSNKFLYIFPKRCFANQSDIEQVRKLINTNISNFKIYS